MNDETVQSGTEDDEESEGTYHARYAERMDISNGSYDDDDDDEEEEDQQDSMQDQIPQSSRNVLVVRGGYNGMHDIGPTDAPFDPTPSDLSMTRERGHGPSSRNGIDASSNAQDISSATPTVAAGPSHRSRGFGHQPLVEASISPTPSDAASNRSGGTNHSSGTAFFRNYMDAAPSTRAGVITPDLVFAEIGHGRGAGPANGVGSARHSDSVVVVSAPHQGSYTTISTDPSSYPISSSSRTLQGEVHRSNGHGSILADASNSYTRSPPRSDIAWTEMENEDVSRSLSASPTTRELQESVQSALGQQQFADGRDIDGRGRSVKRSLRNTINAAEQYFFGRGAGGSTHDATAGPSHNRNSNHGR